MDEFQEAPSQERWLFSALELSDSLALGGDVRLEVDPRITVLVGRNGAGKSAILERIVKALQYAPLFLRDNPPDPGRFACELYEPSAVSRVIRYECSVSPPKVGLKWSARSELLPTPLLPGEFKESCRILGGEEIWRLEARKLRYRGQEGFEILPPGYGLLQESVTPLSRPRALQDRAVQAVLEPLSRLVNPSKLDYVEAGIPRADKRRTAAIIPFPRRPGEDQERRYGHISQGLWRLIYWLTFCHEQASEGERIQELEALGQRLHLFQKIEVQLVPNPEHAADPKAAPSLAMVSVDGVNIGLLSDGTQRVLEILAALVSPDVSLLLIEEPEIAVHPGLLHRLLEEITAYSLDRQVILSTQSPDVVSWARPEALRLVERIRGKTQVRSLSETERARIERYLADEGTLGDYVYHSDALEDG